MERRELTMKAARVLVFISLVVISIINYFSENKFWSLGQYLFNNTVLITGIIGLFIEVYRKK